MSIASLTTSPPPREPGERPFSVDEYHEMIRVGILKEYERVELLAGRIVFKMTHNPIHDGTVDRVQEVLRERVPRSMRVRVQSAITTPDSEPEPDVVVAIGSADRYTTRHPGPLDIALVVEVAETSLNQDRRVKAPLYARAGIATYWIVNLKDVVIEVFTDPQSTGEYRVTERLAADQSVPLTIEGQSLPPIPVRELLP